MANLALKTKNEIFDLIKRAATELYPDADWSGLRTGSFEVRKDVRDIASNLGLVPSERAGATVTLVLVASADVTVPKGTKFETSNGEIFSTAAELVLSSAGSLTGNVIAVHADYKTTTYRARGDSGEIINLDKDNVLVDHLTVTVDGIAWTKVDNLFGLGTVTSAEATSTRVTVAPARSEGTNPKFDAISRTSFLTLEIYPASPTQQRPAEGSPKILWTT